MSPSEWKTILISIYKECRDLPKWEELKKLHDADDQEYFNRLDELLKKAS